MTALAVIATSVAIPAPVPQQIDVCGLGVGVTVGAPKNSHNGPFNVNVIPTTAVTPSLALGYSNAGNGNSFLQSKGIATTFNLTNNILTSVISGQETRAQNYQGDAAMSIPAQITSPLKVFEQEQCVGNEVVSILTATAKGTTFSVTGFAQGAHIHLEFPFNFGGGLGGTGGLGGLNGFGGGPKSMLDSTVSFSFADSSKREIIGHRHYSKSFPPRSDAIPRWLRYVLRRCHTVIGKVVHVSRRYTADNLGGDMRFSFSHLFNGVIRRS